MPGKAFGEFLKDRRIGLGLTLRSFCEKHGFDPGNMSRLERGKLPPPQSREKLEEYARALELQEGSDAWYEFFDLAAASRGELPAELMDDEELVRKLPVLFRTLRGQKVPDRKLEELIEIIRRA